MIPLVIALVVAGGAIGALSFIAAITIGRNNRLEREKKAAESAVLVVRANIKTLQAERDRLARENADLAEVLESTKALYNKLLRERAELVARNTALQKLLEAQPTAPKRTVRKNTAQAAEQEGV